MLARKRRASPAERAVRPRSTRSNRLNPVFCDLDCVARGPALPSRSRDPCVQTFPAKDDRLQADKTAPFQRIKAKDVAFENEADTPTGSEGFVVLDPDDKLILADQHRLPRGTSALFDETNRDSRRNQAREFFGVPVGQPYAAVGACLADL